MEELRMRNLILEEFSVSSISTKELARHMYTRIWSGKIVIVADKPTDFLPSLRKQWLKLAHKVQNERTRTLNAARTTELSSTIARMQSLRFTTKWPPDLELADVYIVTTEQLLGWAPECRTLYVSCSIELEHLHMITAWMPKGGLVVIYKTSEKGIGRYARQSK
jgi:hypothetical protein